METLKIDNDTRGKIFAAYWGADIHITTNIEGNAVVEKMNWTHIEDLTSLYAEDFAFQLLLRPLEAMTDEEAQVICKILGLQFSNTDENFFFDLSGLAEYLTELLNGVNRFEDKYTLNQMVELIDYLRSIGINIGYGKYSAQDLIDAGLVKLINQ